MKTSNEYYTYAYLREDKTPYYVGKGKRNRAYVKRKDGVNPPKDKSKIIFLKQNLTEGEAFKHEIYMIVVFGRKDLGTGILHNRTDGGEGVSGISEETKRKLSEANMGRNNPNFGKSTSDKTRRKQSIANTGKSPSEETRKKLSEALKGRTLSNETRKKLSETLTGRTHSEKTRKKIGEVNIGKKWWNDGLGNSKMSFHTPGPNWVPGMSKRKRYAPIGEVFA
jgi:hypothetical protein